MAWRRRRAGPRSLLALCWRPEPFTGCIQAPAWLRRLWTAAGDFQDHWRAVRTWDAGSCSGFWRFCPYIYHNVRQCSSWRGLSGVCFLSPSDQRHGDSFSQRVSHILIFVCMPRGRPREVVSMRSLRVEGEVRLGEVVPTRSGCGILAEAGMGRLIKPAEFSLVQELGRDEF